MNRRSFITALAAAFPIGLLRGSAAAQDVEFLRALDAAQKQRPSALGSAARIAPASEPGQPLVIHGRIVDMDQRPVGGAVIFAYHTDREGLYDRPAGGGISWRLRGWARTADDGRFEFLTIRPAPYPGRNIPAHVHVNVYAGDARYSAGELRFSDDPLIEESERQRSKEAGDFGWVRPVALRGGVQHVDFRFRLDPARRF